MSVSICPFCPCPCGPKMCSKYQYVRFVCDLDHSAYVPYVRIVCISVLDYVDIYLMSDMSRLSYMLSDLCLLSRVSYPYVPRCPICPIMSGFEHICGDSESGQGGISYDTRDIVTQMVQKALAGRNAHELTQSGKTDRDERDKSDIRCMSRMSVLDR